MTCRWLTALISCLLLAAWLAGQSPRPVTGPIGLELQLPAVVRQGDPLLGRLRSSYPLLASVRLKLPGPADPINLTLFALGDDGHHWDYSLAAGIPVDALPGQASLTITPDNPTAKPGRPAASLERSIQVIKRTLQVEEIALTPAMADIKTTADPRKAEQIRRYAAILASAHPESVFDLVDFRRPLVSQRRTALYGDKRVLRYPDGHGEASYHWGIDYGVPTGTPISAPAAGRVVLAENRITTGWTLIIEHLPGMFSIYMHLSALQVTAGQLVQRGQLLGQSGATGFATGPHLHWELRINNVAVDPEALLELPPGSRRFLP